MTNEYLYGQDIEIPEVPQHVVMRRVELLKDNLEEQLSAEWYLRDAERCNKIIKEIVKWENINE